MSNKQNDKWDENLSQNELDEEREKELDHYQKLINTIKQMKEEIPSLVSRQDELAIASHELLMDRIGFVELVLVKVLVKLNSKKKKKHGI